MALQPHLPVIKDDRKSATPPGDNHDVYSDDFDGSPKADHQKVIHASAHPPKIESDPKLRSEETIVHHHHPKRTIEDIRAENKKFQNVLPSLRAEVNRLVEQMTRPGRRKMIVERPVREKPLYQTIMVFRPLS